MTLEEKSVLPSLSAIIGKDLRVVVRDGRIVRGKLWAIDADCNMVLGECSETPLPLQNTALSTDAKREGEGSEGEVDLEKVFAEAQSVDRLVGETYRGLLLVPGDLAVRVLMKKEEGEGKNTQSQTAQTTTTPEPEES
jgi:small nuclear ribonucleoprotein (snRNP)-like protein